MIVLLFVGSTIAGCNFADDKSSARCCYGTEPQTCGDFRCVDLHEVPFYTVNKINSSIYDGNLVFFGSNIATFGVSQSDLTLPDINDPTSSTWKLVSSCLVCDE